MYDYRTNSQSSTILSFAQGDVTGDFVEDYVYLVGQQTSDSPYNTHITLVIQDGRSNQFFTIPLKTDQAYQPRLFLGDFTGNGTDDIFIRMDSGGSGGFSYFYIYSFLHNMPSLLFDYEVFDQTFIYKVLYQDDYQVKVINETMDLQFMIDLSGRDPEYLSEIYGSDGKLLKPLEGFVSGLNQLYPVDFDNDGVYELFALQRIAGQYNADQLGVVQTPLSWKNGQFAPLFENQWVAVFGEKQG
ncbi:VCBS repeat-containing protein [Halobacillus fulvus]|nr:VCBS repeat-containing protein [Halobacillus fulvus]